MADDQPPHDLARWLVANRETIDLQRHITIKSKSTAQGERTTVEIDHLVSCHLPGRDGWRVTTKRMYLPQSHFHSSAAHTLKTSDHGRGRTIYCLDHGCDDEVVAALSYHLGEQESWPLFVTAIGFRVDFPRNAELRRRTLEAAFLLKQYAHAIGVLAGRGADIHAEVPPNALTRYANELGFRKARRLRGLRASGTHLRQPPLVD